MLSQEDREIRDPAAIQLELLEIEKQFIDLMPELQERNQAYQSARAEFEVSRLKLKLLKERRSSLQSVLKSLI